MNQRFIVVSSLSGANGTWGHGDTREAAEAACAKAWKESNGRRPKALKTLVYKFTSDYPFVPIGDKREATDNEADCWVDSDGFLCYINCDKEKIA